MKKNETFTPGPWVVQKIRNRDVHIKESYETYDVYAKSKDGMIFVAECGEVKCEETFATARLVSAAPELLEACKELVDIGITDPELFSAYTKAMKAIAKAEGGKK